MKRVNELRIRRPRLRTAVIAVFVAALSLSSGTVAYAAFNPTVTTTGSVQAGQVSLSVSDTLNNTMRNSDSRPTRPVTITNTTAGPSTQRASVSLNVSGSGDSSVTGGPAWLWPVSDASVCSSSPSVGQGVISGQTSKMAPLASGITVNADLAPGESISYCVQAMKIAGYESPTGTKSIVLTARATATVGSFQGAASASGTWATLGIYPGGSPDNGQYYQVKPTNNLNTCLDVTGGAAAAADAEVATYTCHTQFTDAYANQWVAVKNTSVASVNYQMLNFKAPANRSLQLSGSTLTASVPNVTATSTQQWFMQRVSADVYQIVSNNGGSTNGYCLTAPENTGALTLSLCDNLSSQQFNFSKLNKPVTLSQLLEEQVTEDTTAAVDGEDAAEVTEEPAIRPVELDPDA